MSRTYKDRPTRIQASDPRNRKNSYEEHWCGPRWEMIKYKSLPAVRIYGYDYVKKIPTLWTTTYTECTLHDDVKYGGRWDYTGCHYLPLHQTDWDWNYSKFTQDARDFYNGVQRAERRGKTKRMADEYNACGIIEDDYVFDSFKKKDGWD